MQIGIRICDGADIGIVADGKRVDVEPQFVIGISGERIAYRVDLDPSDVPQAIVAPDSFETVVIRADASTGWQWTQSIHGGSCRQSEGVPTASTGFSRQGRFCWRPLSLFLVFVSGKAVNVRSGVTQDFQPLFPALDVVLKCLRHRVLN
jgi:hypothetical protein